MKNIIWQQGDGQLAYFAYADDVDTQAMAVTLKAEGAVDADWTAVAFDRELPTVRQDTWRFVGGEFTFVAPPPESKAQRIANVLAALAVPMSRPQVQGIIIACEGYAKAMGLTLAFIYERTKLYKVCKDAEAACQAIENEP